MNENKQKKALFENCKEYGISGVYAITNKEIKERYIGSSKDILKRWHQHTQSSHWELHPNNPLYQEMQKSGIDNFTFTIVALVEPEHLKEVEQSAMKMLNHEYNSYYAHVTKSERKEYQKAYNKSERGKAAQKKYSASGKRKAANKKYNDQICIYEGEELKLAALTIRFKRLGITHPATEAKKYLKKY